MKFPNWAKIIWWIALIIGLTFFLKERLPDLLSGQAKAADVVVFGVWMALLMTPLFDEVTLLGVTLKKQIEKLKEEVTNQIADIRTDIRSVTDVRTNVSHTFNIPSLPLDSELPKIKEEITAAVAAAFAEHGRNASTAELQAPESAIYLFQIRFLIEAELNRIARKNSERIGIKRSPTISLLARNLMEIGAIEERLVNAVKEVNSICTPAIHGDLVSDAQVKLVRDVAPGLISALRSISNPDI